MFKRATYFAIGVILSLLSVAITSCEGYNPAYNRENIKATWLADDGNVYQFNKTVGLEKSGKVTISGKNYISEGNYKWIDNSLFYEVDCCVLEITGDAKGVFNIPSASHHNFDLIFDITEQKDSLLTITPTRYFIDDTEVIPEYTTLKMRKLKSSHSLMDSLKGTWQHDTFRLILSDTQFLFQTKDSEDTWISRVVGDEGKDYCNRYDNLLVLTLFDNSILGTPLLWNVVQFNILKASPYNKELVLETKEGKTYHFELVTE